ncbi:MAG: hypothetical protein P0121_02580 [Nitrospira sp.]|nr:hypothetical protein [Nitrospira sp.]
MGEVLRKAVAGQKGAMALDPFGGRIHVEWDPAAAVTSRGQLPFFIEFLKVSGLFEGGGLPAGLPQPPRVGYTHRARHRAAVDPRRPPPRRA